MNQKYSKIEKNSKKKIVVLTMSISAGSSYIADLKEILPPDQVEYLLYTPETCLPPDSHRNCRWE